jgi:hypothetical protein
MYSESIRGIPGILPLIAMRAVAKACFAGRKQIFAFADRENAATRCIAWQFIALCHEADRF